jgi:hypothetical protein
MKRTNDSSRYASKSLMAPKGRDYRHSRLILAPLQRFEERAYGWLRPLDQAFVLSENCSHKRRSRRTMETARVMIEQFLYAVEAGFR